LNSNHHTMVTDLINSGMGDRNRLEFILECIQKGKPLYNTDEKYLRQKYQKLETKIDKLSGGKMKKSKTTPYENDLDKIVDEALSREKQIKTIPQIQEKLLLKESFMKKSLLSRLFSRK